MKENQEKGGRRRRRRSGEKSCENNIELSHINQKMCVPLVPYTASRYVHCVCVCVCVMYGMMHNKYVYNPKCTH